MVKHWGWGGGETNKKVLLRTVPHEIFHLFHFYSLQMVEVRVVQQKTAEEVIYSVIYSTSELTKRQVLQSF